MDYTAQANVFRDVFENSLKINARSLSVKTLLSERNLKRIDYSPYYQRNYVWDKEKQTFFIESVILGTEVPPLILFKVGSRIEVIDGRQRFETLKKFKENDLVLTPLGLKELNTEALSKKSFNKLSEKNQSTFLDSNIRIFEFEIVNRANLTEKVIDKVKKEIFRRYNTGITPLTRNELDNAKYDTDDFSDYFRKELEGDEIFFNDFNSCFTTNKLESKNIKKEEILSKNVDLIRRFRILKDFPISTYAGSSRRGEIIDLLYDFSNTSSEDIESDYLNLKDIINQVVEIWREFRVNDNLNNRLIYECLVWMFSIIKEESVGVEIDVPRLRHFLLENISYFILDDYHFYAKIIKRYEVVLSFLTSDCGLVGLDDYIRDSSFRHTLKDISQSDEEMVASIESHSSLRLHKPNPTSIPVDEILNELNSTKYLLRPSYQRQEKISHQKASSIIESILLGINLPPVFIYKRSSGLKEVVDGQQRLLSIVGFLGREYVDEKGNKSRSLNNNFKLKDLRVLTKLEGEKYSDLDPYYQDRILDFVLDQIIIEESLNEYFDPIDLFVRLNYKPYPIKTNSFEMWNSIVDPDVIKEIKRIAKGRESNWFFLREIGEGKPDRMSNEEMITTLAYINYLDEDVVGFFLRNDRISCRIKDKKGLNDFLVDLDNKAKEKEKFLEAVSLTCTQIRMLGGYFSDRSGKERFSDYLNVRENKNFRRSLQDFYLIWVVLKHVSLYKLDSVQEILVEIRELIEKLRNIDNCEMDQLYLDDFLRGIKAVQDKWS